MAEEKDYRSGYSGIELEKVYKKLNDQSAHCNNCGDDFLIQVKGGVDIIPVEFDYCTDCHTEHPDNV